MKNSEIKNKCNDIIQDLILSKQLVNTRTVLELLPDILSSLSIDKKYIFRRIQVELRKPSANPINAVLGIFGMRLIRTESMLNTIDGNLNDELDLKIVDETTEFLRLNEDVFSKTTNDIANRLKELEDSTQQTLDYLRNQNSTLHGQLAEKEGSLSQLKTDYQDHLNIIAERVQYILCLQGRGSTDPVVDQLIELLADLDLKAVWKEDSRTPALDTMFVSFNCTKIEKRREKPCIMYGDKVLLKGVVFAEDESSKE